MVRAPRPTPRYFGRVPGTRFRPPRKNPSLPVSRQCVGSLEEAAQGGLSCFGRVIRDALDTWADGLATLATLHCSGSESSPQERPESRVRPCPALSLASSMPPVSQAPCRGQPSPGAPYQRKSPRPSKPSWADFPCKIGEDIAARHGAATQWLRPQPAPAGAAWSILVVY